MVEPRQIVSSGLAPLRVEALVGLELQRVSSHLPPAGEAEEVPTPQTYQQLAAVSDDCVSRYSASRCGVLFPGLLVGIH